MVVKLFKVFIRDQTWLLLVQGILHGLEEDVGLGELEPARRAELETGPYFDGLPVVPHGGDLEGSPPGLALGVELGLEVGVGGDPGPGGRERGDLLGGPRLEHASGGAMVDDDLQDMI